MLEASRPTCVLNHDAPPRIVVLGSSCAGKSTFAAQLHQALGVPCIELDELYWGPDWTPRPNDEFLSLTNAATAAQAWVLVGNYRPVRTIVWPRANVAVWLNYGFGIVFWRALTRTVRRVWTREVLWNGNRESIRRSFFSKDSILLWVLNTYHRRRREFEVLSAGADHPHIEWIEFRHPREAAEFLNRLQAGSKRPV